MEYDVTSLVEGDGTYTFVLAMTSDDDAVADNVVFTSRESAQPPQLVITAARARTRSGSHQRRLRGLRGRKLRTLARRALCGVSSVLHALRELLNAIIPPCTRRSVRAAGERVAGRAKRELARLESPT